MAKPIFLVQINHAHLLEQGVLNQKKTDAIRGQLEKRLPDWHVLVVINNVRDMEFSAFSEQSASDIEIESLKEMLINQINEKTGVA